MLLVTFWVAFAAAGLADDEKMRLGEFIPVDPPQPAPQVGFTDADGNPATLADLKGKPAIVNLWATWCEPCLKEMPSLVRLQGALKDKLVVAAISEDRGGAKIVVPFVAEKGLTTLKVYLDPKMDVAHALNARGLPTSIVLDPEGRIVGTVVGPAEWDGDKMRGILRPLLKDAGDEIKHAAR